MTRIDIDNSDLDWAAEQGVISVDQSRRLWRALLERRENDGAHRISPATGVVYEEEVASPAPRFDLPHVAWYAGSLIVMGALGWFATLGIERWGGPGIVGIAGTYAAAFAGVGARLWRSAQLKVLGGLLIAVAVSVAPLVMYGVQRTLGVWPDVDPGSYAGFYAWVKGGWFGLELAGIVAGVIAVRRVPFPFVLLPVALCVWFASMDLTPLLVGSSDDEAYSLVSAVTGALTLCAVGVMRARGGAHLTYWLEVVGVVALDVGLAGMRSDSLWTKLPFLLLQLGFLVVGARVMRGVFIIAGTLGVLGVSGWALEGTFRADRIVACLLVGVPLVAFGLACQRHRFSYGAALGFVCGAGVLAIGPFDAWHDAPELQWMLVLHAAWNIVFVVLGVCVRARLLTGVGGLALAGLLAWLAHGVFRESMLFPPILVLLGVGVVYLGVQLEKRRSHLDAWVEARVPPWLRALRPPTTSGDRLR